MKNKKQHWVPESYLKAWIDPNTPSEQDGYVWLFNRNGDEQKNKAPKNIFHESDFYTKKNVDGSKDLTLEQELGKIEKRFSILRRNKLDSLQDLTNEDISTIIEFAAIMMYRTKPRRDKEKQQWGYALEVMDDMAEQIKINPNIRPLPSLHHLSSSKNSLSHDDVRILAQEPIQNILPLTTEILADILVKMNLHILCTSSHPGFITSDHPCVMYDPLYTSDYLGLGCPSIEVTIPISPKQLAIFFWSEDRNLPQEYAYAEIANEELVDIYNSRTRFFCEEYFVVNDNIKKDCWIEQTK